MDSRVAQPTTIPVFVRKEHSLFPYNKEISSELFQLQGKFVKQFKDFTLCLQFNIQRKGLFVSLRNSISHRIPNNLSFCIQINYYLQDPT